MTPLNDQRALVLRVLKHATADEKEALKAWAEQLLLLRQTNLSVARKAREALALSVSNQVAIPIMALIAKELKLDRIDVSKIRLSSYRQVLSSIRRFWADRSLAAKLGIGASTVALAVFGTKGAGIAALGTAVGVPLWVVFGAGATFAGVMYEEIAGKKPDLTTTYKVIDAIKTDDEGIVSRTLAKLKLGRRQ